MNQKRYKIGQVVYAIMSEENKVIPLQIVEIVTKRTLQGEATIYKVIFGGDATKKLLTLSDIKGEIFETLQEVKNFLMENVTNWVNAQLQNAQKKASAWYKVQPESSFDDIDSIVVHEVPAAPSEPVGQVEEGDTNLVELPGGQVVKARVTRGQKT